jgi:hypothetical protein
MANKRIKDLSDTATSMDAGDYLVVDAADDKTKKILWSDLSSGLSGGGSSTGAGEFLGRVDFNSGGSGNNWTHTHINNAGHSLPDPADLIQPTAHNNFPQNGSPLEFKNVTNNTYVIENVEFVNRQINEGRHYTTIILPPNTKVGVYDGTYEGMFNNNTNNTYVTAHSWYIYQGGGKEYGVDSIKVFNLDLRTLNVNNLGVAVEADYNVINGINFPLELPHDGFFIEGTAI